MPWERPKKWQKDKKKKEKEKEIVLQALAGSLWVATNKCLGLLGLSFPI